MRFNINDFVNQAHLAQGIVFLKRIIKKAYHLTWDLNLVMRDTGVPGEQFGNDVNIFPEPGISFKCPNGRFQD
jgi:hypothetical protein